MVFNRVVQIGRVVFIASGKDQGKLAAIVNVIDGNRVSHLLIKKKKCIADLLNFT